MGEHGAREAVWAAILREAAQAAVSELCPPNPGGIAGAQAALTEPRCVCRAGRGAGCAPAGHRDIQSDPSPQGPPGPCLRLTVSECPPWTLHGQDTHQASCRGSA